MTNRTRSHRWGYKISRPLIGDLASRTNRSIPPRHARCCEKAGKYRFSRRQLWRELTLPPSLLEKASSLRHITDTIPRVTLWLPEFNSTIFRREAIHRRRRRPLFLVGAEQKCYAPNTQK